MDIFTKRHVCVCFLRSQWPLLCHVLGYYGLPQLGQFLSVFARGLSNGVSAECETPEKFLVGSMIRSIFSQKVKCLAQVSFLRGSIFFYTGNEIKKFMPKCSLETRIFLCNAKIVFTVYLKVKCLLYLSISNLIIQENSDYTIKLAHHLTLWWKIISFGMHII
jgi:hypothetical protein